MSSRCGWTLGKSVAGETICKFFTKTTNDLKKCVSAALNTHLAKTMNRLMAYKYHMFDDFGPCSANLWNLMIKCMFATVG